MCTPDKTQPLKTIFIGLNNYMIPSDNEQADVLTDGH